MSEARPKLEVAFFRTETGSEPVREWLRGLPRADRQAIGREIRTVQFGWPVGMPVVRKLEDHLWEVRVTLDKRIGRVIFTVIDTMAVLLHGFMKKSRKTPSKDLSLARRRDRKLRTADRFR